MSPHNGQAGQQIGHFRIVRLIGSGGMGTVYEATDVFLGRTVALKVLTPHTEELGSARERFFREARAVARLEHPNIVRIYEADSNPENPFIAMELIRGGDIRQVMLGDERWPRPRLCELAAQVYDGLGHAHAHGVIHRDVKPANVLLTPEGTVKLIDFGLARLHDDDRDLTRGQVFGSAAYMPPEQILDPRSLDHRADIYSAGALLYQLMTGKVPHLAATVAELLGKVVNMDVPDPRRIVADLEPWLAMLIMNCLARNRDDRPASATDVAKELRAHFAASLRTVSSAGGQEPPPPIPRRSLAIDPGELPTTRQEEHESGGEIQEGDPAAPSFLEDGVFRSRELSAFELTTTGEGHPVLLPTLLPPPASPGSRRLIAAAAGVGLGILLAAVGFAVALTRSRPSAQFAPFPTSSAVSAPEAPPPTARAKASVPASSVRLVALSPDPGRGLRLEARLGQTVEFRVRAEGTTLQPRWLVNDDPVAEGPSYFYRPLRSATRDLVSVSVGEPGSDQTAALSWYVSVK